MYAEARRFVLVTICLLFLVSVASDSRAQNAPAHQLTFGNAVLVQGNPMNVLDTAELEYRYRLYDDERRLFRTNYLSAKLTPAISPAYTRLGGGLEVMPFSLVRLGVSYEWIRYFGTFDQLQSFSDASTEWDDDTLDARAAEGLNEATSGTRLNLTMLLQGQLGSFAARSTFEVFRLDMNLEADAPLYYDLSLDILAPASGWGLENDTDVLYLTDVGLVMGLRYSAVHVFYDDVLLEGANPNSPVQRIGPLVSYLIYERPGELVDGLTLFGLVQWYMEHRFRTGADQSPVVPFVILGVNLTGSLL